ncbi:MAG TPA: histidine phosphatase family protein [Nevskiaceae bacterium]|nr:histidine phosphatase family protein [Nevskiaceae bacterium]
MSIDLLRHGETGQSGFRGQLDDPLTARGWQQMRTTVAGHEWDRIVSSPLQRCAAFARELAATRRVPLAADARLAEYDFGAWSGIPLEHLAADEGEALAQFWADPAGHPPPGAETLAAFEMRVEAAVDQLADEAATQRILIVTHGGPIRLLRCRAQARPLHEMSTLTVPHAALTPLMWPPHLKAR